MGGRNKVVLHLYLCLLANAFAEIWPPFGHLTPNNYIPPPVCKYEQEKVYEDILEEVCTTEDVENCSVKVVSEQESSSETVCEDVVETICDNSCDELDPETCEKCDDNQPTCQPVFKMETKTECSYETKMDKKCFRMYEVTYVDDCQEIVQTQCKLFHNFLCDKVNRRKCTKVPKLSSERCRNVPRLKENCRELLVRRPAGKCRSQCNGTTTTRQARSSNNCRNVNKKSCRQVPTQKLVEKSKNVCEKTPNRTCRTEKVKRLKLIPKKICTELKQPDEEAKEP